MEAKFVKVHSHFDNLDPYAEPSFINKLTDIMKPYFSDEVIGANGGAFEKSKEISLTNATAGSLEDYAAYIPLKELGIQDDCKPDMSDVRFVFNGRTLYHFFDGSGFYVRIPFVDGEGRVTVTVLYGNANAMDVSTGEGTFEAKYGRINLFSTRVGNTAVDGMDNSFGHEHKVRTMSNGDMIAIGATLSPSLSEAAKSVLTLRRSTDGGRTWGAPERISEPVPPGYLSGGSFVVDPVTHRVFYFGYHYNGFVANMMSSSDSKMFYIYSDDNGHTWSDINYIRIPDRPYALSYCNPLITSIYDGEGPNVDFVMPYAFQADNTGSLAVSAIYSTDAGETWKSSNSAVTMNAQGFEGGVSESAIIEREDGTLYMLLRAQATGNDRFYASYSYDYGITWDEEASISNVYTTNTMPVFRRNNGDLLLLWQGNNTLGGLSYRRFPLNIAYSKDDGRTWERIL